MQAPVVFLKVPQSLRGFKAASAGGEEFRIDADIPIPVEPREGEETLDLASLSWEQIVSAMIRVVQETPGSPHADYYRRFVLAVKPEIKSEFAGAALFKARNGDYDMCDEILAALESLFPGGDNDIRCLRALIEDERMSDEAQSERALDEIEAALRLGKREKAENIFTCGRENRGE